MPAAARGGGRTYRPRDFPRVFALLTRVQLTDRERKLRDRLNPYKRQALRLAFEAGWNTARHQDTLLGVLKSGLMSDLGKSAFYAGAEARLTQDKPQPRRKHGQSSPPRRGGRGPRQARVSHQGDPAG